MFMNDTSPTRTEVLIVGAGPSGLALANTLAKAGVSHVILDKLQTAQSTSRAAVLHAHTLDVLDEIGVSERLVAQGLNLAKFSIRDRDRALVQLRFDDLPSRHSSLLMLPQDRTEAVLTEALVEAGSSVQRGWTVEAIEDRGDYVRGSAVSEQGKRTFDARYVVGADGMHSIVRKTAGIGFSGSSYEDSFVLADVEMQWSHGRDEVKLFFSPQGLVVVAPLPGGAFRIVATLADAPERPDIAHIQALLDARGPRSGTTTVTKVRWSSRFRLQHRVADGYRNGRLFLVGDAAHVHSPAGGQGMNTGLVDGWVLGRVLSEVISGRQDEAFLDTYQTMRRPAAVKVLKLAGRLTHMATMKYAPQRAVRNLLLSTIDRLPKAKRKLELALSGLARRDAARLPGVEVGSAADPMAPLRQCRA
jgi:2-polyprenyl-6-methoxyphenol hydroxylase-like FAD-dependent oxidoreductase